LAVNAPKAATPRSLSHAGARAIAGRSFSVARIWQGQNARQANILGSDSDALVRLTIAKIKLDAVIVEGTSRKSLTLGPGQMQDSALPGYSGNSVIVAHRDTFFRQLKDIRENDEIQLQTATGRFRYAVDWVKVVEPTDTTVLEPSTQESALTIVTCYPFYFLGSAPKRFVVRAHKY